MSIIVSQNPREIKEKYRSSEKRFLGVDFGEARIGLALSDVGREIANPLAVVPAREAVREIAAICTREDVGLVVIGLPREMSGAEGAMVEKARAFADLLAAALPDEIELAFFDERLTTALANRALIETADMSRAKRRQKLDAVAAAHLLQGFIDGV